MKLRGDPVLIFKNAADIICGGFDLDEENRTVVADLIKYFTFDKNFERASNNANFSFRKGVLIFGNPGSGKSILLEIFMVLVRNIMTSYKEMKCSDVVNKFAENGAEYIKSLSGNIFFDDLAYEKIAIHFGDRRELMEDIIYNRYDLWRDKGCISHFTTMASIKEIRERYGEFIWSRLNQMCNLYGLGTKEDSTDRRMYKINPVRPDISKITSFFITPEEEERIRDVKSIQKCYDKMKENAKNIKQGHKGLGTLLKESMNKIMPSPEK